MLIVGYYGEFNLCMEMAKEFINFQITESIELNEGIIAIASKDRIAFVYKTNHEIYDRLNKADSTNLAVTYLRFLMDTCHKIFAVQP